MKTLYIETVAKIIFYVTSASSRYYDDLKSDDLWIAAKDSGVTMPIFATSMKKSVNGPPRVFSAARRMAVSGAKVQLK